MGDVALTLPVLKGLLERNEELAITLVTRSLFLPFFEEIPRLEVFTCDFTGKYAGLPGLFRLFKKLRTHHKYDSVVDLHGVLRTRVLNFLFRLSGLSIHKIDKGRSEKKKLVRGIIFQPLKNTIDRYLEPFEAFSLKFEYPASPVMTIHDHYLREAENYLQQKEITDRILIGVAPFALHELKTWPLLNMEKLIQLFEDRYKAQIFLYGGAQKEIIQLENLVKENPDRINLAGKFPLGTQLAFLRKMQFMVTMDSANMHLAALSGVKTITIWGATHPFAGFSAYLQPPERNIQISKEELSCRPCTVFGSGTCRRGDFACMRWLTPEKVFEKINALDLIEQNPD
jgi:ADP-heptose:LPS heptosyltransferase